MQQEKCSCDPVVRCEYVFALIQGLPFRFCLTILQGKQSSLFGSYKMFQMRDRDSAHVHDLAELDVLSKLRLSLDQLRESAVCLSWLNGLRGTFVLAKLLRSCSWTQGYQSPANLLRRWWSSFVAVGRLQCAFGPDAAGDCCAPLRLMFAS